MKRKKKARILLLAGVTAFAYYLYSKLTAEQKNDLLIAIRETSRKLYDQFMPEPIKNMFQQNNDLINFDYGENSDYPG